MNNKKFDGNVLKMAATVDTVFRDVVVFDESIGIAQTAGLTGEQIAVEVVGVYELASTDADVFAVGDIVGYDPATGAIVADETVGKAGVSWSAKAAGVSSPILVKIG